MKEDPVSDLECREPVLVQPDQSLRSAVKLMRQGKLGCAILVDQEQRPLGIFMESKLTRILASKPSAIDDLVKDHVDDTWPQVNLSDPIFKVLEALVTRNTRFLVVVDDEGRVVKVTGQKGLMKFIADHFPGQVAVQRIGQKPYMHEREGA